MIRTIVLDMDGTLANTYAVQDWLPKLRAEDPSPYVEAEPLFDADTLYPILTFLQELGVRIIINTWLSKGSSLAYDDAVRVAKMEWLEKYEFPYDEIHITKYGRTKADATRRKYDGEQVLFDDNEKVRKGWHLGRAVDAKDMIQTLEKILAEVRFMRKWGTQK